MLECLHGPLAMHGEQHRLPTQRKVSKVAEEKALPEEAKKVLQDFQRQIQELQMRANVYVRGVAQGMEIPKDWQFDEKRMVFVKPERHDGKGSEQE